MLFLYVHVVAFAIALGCVLREDAKLVSTSAPIDLGSLRVASRIVATALAVLWASGLAIIILDTGGHLMTAAANAKLLAKVFVVCVLTLNGFALHAIAFPLLRRPAENACGAAHVAAVFGAISAVSWAFATFLGVSRDVANGFTFAGVIIVYTGALVVGICAGLILVAPIVRRKMRERLTGVYAHGDHPRLRMH